MVRDAESILLPGEKLIYWSEPHWIIYGPCIVTALIGIAFLLARNFFGLLILFGAGLWSVDRMLERGSIEVALTNQRFILKRGRVTSEIREMNLDQIELVGFAQSPIGEMFDYGSISVFGTGGGIEGIAPIPSPTKLRNLLQTAIRGSM